MDKGASKWQGKVGGLLGAPGVCHPCPSCLMSEVLRWYLPFLHLSTNAASLKPHSPPPTRSILRSHLPHVLPHVVTQGNSGKPLAGPSGYLPATPRPPFLVSEFCCTGQTRTRDFGRHFQPASNGNFNILYVFPSVPPCFLSHMEQRTYD